MKDFNKRIEKLPNTRQTWVIIMLKELIKDMWDEGWSANGIAERLGKDHTTILHHLWTMGIDPSERIEKMKASNSIYRDMVRAKKIKEHESSVLARHKAKKELADALESRKKRVQADREKAVKFYKSGKSYSFIQDALGVSAAALQGMLNYSDEYQAIKRPGGYSGRKPVNQFTKEGKLIKRWPSMAAAADSLGIDRGSITMACRGRIPSRAGYKWEYAKK